MEGLQSRLASISEEKDQLQEALESLRQQKQQLQEELEDRMEAVRGHLMFTNDVAVRKPLRGPRETKVMFSFTGCSSPLWLRPARDAASTR